MISPSLTISSTTSCSAMTRSCSCSSKRTFLLGWGPPERYRDRLPGRSWDRASSCDTGNRVYFIFPGKICRERKCGGKKGTDFGFGENKKKKDEEVGVGFWGSASLGFKGREIRGEMGFASLQLKIPLPTKTNRPMPSPPTWFALSVSCLHAHTQLCLSFLFFFFFLRTWFLFL